VPAFVDMFINGQRNFVIMLSPEGGEAL